MPILHLILRKEFKDISMLVDYLKSSSECFDIVEHDPDESEDPKRGQFNVKHCHCMIVDFFYSDESLRKFLVKSGLGGRGQYAILSKTQKTREDYDFDKLGVYIHKGCYDASALYCIPVSKVEEWKAAWVTPSVDRNEISKKKKDFGEKKEKSKSHWEIMDDIWSEAEKESGIWDEFCGFTSGKQLNHKGRDTLFDIMVKHLNNNKVRTSRNELERFYVTLLRRDDRQVGLLRIQILKNVFRDYNG